MSQLLGQSMLDPLSRTDAWMQTVCVATCPQNRCNISGTYRPLVRGACGPPCAIAGSCPGDNDGCSAACSPLPANAHFYSGGENGNQASCLWICDPGYHYNQNKTGCDACLQSNPAAYCQGGMAGYIWTIIPLSTCTPTLLPSHVCQLCVVLPNAVAVGWNATTSACVYQCTPGFFWLESSNNNATGGSCVACNSRASICPVGFYSDTTVCGGQQPPVCRQCAWHGAPGVVSYLTNGNTSAYGCMGVCGVGFHTFDNATTTYLTDSSLAVGVVGANLACIACTWNDGRTCASEGCSLGFFRNLQVDTGQANSCLVCKTNSDCPAGSYASTCNGNGTTNAVCLPCPALGPNRIYVNYAAQWSPYDYLVTPIQGNCPWACANNYYRDSTTAACVSCISNADYAKAGFLYSYWSALPKVPWWPLQQTPSSLIPPAELVVGGKWPMAGQCVFCPLGSNVEAGDTDLCILIGGYTRRSRLPPVVTYVIPTIGSDLMVVYQETRPLTLVALATGRRLLEVSGAKPVQTTQIMRLPPPSFRARKLQQALDADPPAPCPHGFFKASRGDSNCAACPLGRSTTDTTASDISACLCLPGYAAAPRTTSDLGVVSACELCPPDTYTGLSRTTAEVGCTACGANETTWGHWGSTGCGCKAGFMRGTTGQCVLCPPGFFCEPCIVGDKTCPTSGVRMTHCYNGATSTPGSWAVGQCFCVVPGYVTVSTYSGGACVPLPLGGEVFAGSIRCKTGWTTQIDKLTGGISCTLCSPGSFAQVNSDGSALISNGQAACSLCPPNTYSGSAVAMGGCTPCPNGQKTWATALGAGATDSLQCLCAPGQGKDASTGLCIGCSSYQYTDLGSGQCVGCPSNMIAAQGSSSKEECQCPAGYEKALDYSCNICPIGSYSISAGVQCQKCPVGSTTRATGSKSKRECGSSPALCESGYIFIPGGGGCASKSVVYR